MKTALLLLCLAGNAYGDRFAPFQQVRDRWRTSDPRLLDRQGRPLQEARVDFHGRRLEWVELGQISSPAKEAALRAEDRRFFSHRGVDWRALAGGALRAVLGKPVRGASTISMQVASFLDPTLRPGRGRRGLWQKWQQMQGAWDLEILWSKDQILEAYFNLVSFRGELRGVGAAARALFDKDPHGLSDLEGRVLAALIRSPNADPDSVARRACGLSTKGDCSGVSDTVRLALSARTIRPRADEAPHLARLLRGPGDVRTTLDLDVQVAAREILTKTLADLRAEHVANGAVLVLDNATGDVLAYLGDLPEGSQVDGVRARRQAGSTLKPLLYGLAFDLRRITPSSLLLDAPLDVPFPRGVYRPSNYDNRFRGPVSARRSLAESLNVPAVRTLMLVGVERFLDLLERAGFEGLKSGDHYGPSLALGSADVSLWELTSAYRALARGGEWSAPHFVVNRGERTERRLISAAAAYLVGDILSDRTSRVGTFGWESPLATRFWAAVKTGTSKDMRDNWALGYTSEFTVGVWVGNFAGDSMWNVSGASGAAPIWKELTAWLNGRRPGKRPESPAGVARRQGEVYLVGTEPTPAVGRVTGGARILVPAPGSRFAWDPDIPAGRQRILFEARGGRELGWELDGRRVGAGTDPVPWAPVPGKHVLTLSSAGRVADRVEFEVRGVEDTE